MIPETNIDYPLDVITDFNYLIGLYLSEFTDKSFSDDVYGHSKTTYGKTIALHHVGFVLFLMAFEIDQRVENAKDYEYYFQKYRLKMIGDYLWCLGIKDDVISSIINRHVGIGSMRIDSEGLSFTVF